MCFVASLEDTVYTIFLGSAKHFALITNIGSTKQHVFYGYAIANNIKKNKRCRVVNKRNFHNIHI